MKKKVFFIFLLVLVLSLVLIKAANETTVDGKAYACLEDKVNGNCDSLSTEEKIFSLLAIGECKSELISDSDNSECWPEGECTIKTTAQAILALRTGTTKAEEWLMDQSMSFPDIEWFLQVESENEVGCTADYGGSSYDFTVNADKTLSGNAGSCLTIFASGGGYWFAINPNCYDEEFSISCDTSFITSLLYRKKNSQTLYVSDKTDSASGGGSTTEKVVSSCFEQAGTCNYEGTLWAAIVLQAKDYDISPYIPYLVVAAADNPSYIPESFLYSLTNNFRTELLAKQKENKYWSESGDKFYDTAVALLPFQNEELMEKTNAKNWLKELQGDNGCWQDNIRNTAFLLYSLWPRKMAEEVEMDDCTDFGYYCVSSAACSGAGGNELSSYVGCFGTNICCDKPQQTQTCAEQGGKICASSEECLGGSFVSSSDSQTCCVNGGTCGVKEAPECEIKGGSCRTSCLSNEQIISYACTSNDVCCVTKKKSYVGLIIFLIILIILTVLGIVFREKLKKVFLQIKSKLEKGKGKGKAGPVGPGPRFPPTSSSRIPPRSVLRRIIPSRPQRPAASPPPAKNKSEFDEVLKKLKEIGK